MNPQIHLGALACTLLTGCAMLQSSNMPPPEQLEAARASITAAELDAHIRELASDRYEGRLPGTHGETLTVEYLTAQFKKFGLQPGNPDGSYVQDVALVGIDGRARAKLTAGGKRLRLRPREDFVAVTSRFEPQVQVKDSELVFVGYGVTAPEYSWDDYKGLDVKGKTLVMLINDPASPDESLFKGKAMTYYGRWTYKYEMASKLGAAAAIIVHEAGPAGYPWAVVGNSWTGEQFELAAANRNAHRVPVQGWITLDKARELFGAAGQDFDALKAAATRRDFKPVALNARADFRIRNKLREVKSRNVVARLPGAQDPDEHLLYTAHWDHLGRDTTLPGDQIFNGALDNASGVAGLLEIAEAYTKLPQPPRRSVLFLAVTAEEQGLLGSKAYAAHPLYPLSRTLAVLNMDGLNVWGPTRDIEVIGMGQTTLEDVLADVAAARGRAVVPDTEPEKGFYYRSDQFEFAKEGLPALYADSGKQVLGRPEGYGLAKRQEYTQKDYHKPSDEPKPDWDLSGASEDMELLLEVGLRVAQSDEWPQWRKDSEFRARRLQMLSGR